MTSPAPVDAQTIEECPCFATKKIMGEWVARNEYGQMMRGVKFCPRCGWDTEAARAIITARQEASRE